MTATVPRRGPRLRVPVPRLPRVPRVHLPHLPHPHRPAWLGGRPPVDERHGRRSAARAAAAEPGYALATVTMFVAVVLSLIGTIMILSSSSVAPATGGASSFATFERQLLWLFLGLVALWATGRADYHRLRGMVVPGLVISLGLLVAVLLPGVGRSANGAQRWIGVGAFQLQPAEPAKFAVILFMATLLSRHWKRLGDTRLTLRPACVVTGAIAFLLLMQPNLGTTIVICSIVGTMLFWAGIPLRPLVVLGTVGILATGYFALSADYRRDRVTAFLDPWEDPAGTGYQTIQSLIGVASGGVSGTGLGASRAKWGFLPEAHTDFVFAVLGEELGLVGALVVVALFVVLVVCGFRIAARAREPFGAMLAVGITSWFAVQAFVNVGAVIGLLPVTGVPLPFVSFGGSSLLATMAAAGILRSIAKQARPAPAPVARGPVAAARPATAGRRRAPGRLRPRS